MKTKFILETSTLEDVLMKKYLDMKKQDSKACDVCEQTPCQCNKSDEKELAEGHFNHSIDDAFKMLDDLMRQERDLDIEPMLKRLSPELQKQLVQWAQTDGKAAVANDEYPEADWATEINKYLPGVAESSKTNFRTAAEQQSLNLIEKIKNSNLSDVVKLYLITINDPTMPVFKASYRSFPKGNEAKNQVKKLIAQKYNVDVKELEDAEKQLMSASLQGKKSNGLEEATPGKSQENHDAKLTDMAEDQDDECPVHGYYALPNQEDESGCTCDSENQVEEGSFDPQHYFDANKDSKVRRNSEVDQSQHKQNWGRDPLDDITHLAFKAGEKVKGMFKKPSELNELGANNPPQGTAPAPTANTAANTAVNTSTLNPQEQKQLDDLLKKAGVVK